MIYKDRVVDIPQRPHRIRLATLENGTKYVYLELGRAYAKNNVYNVTTRLNIGKVINTAPTKMHPNKNYYEFFNHDGSEKNPEFTAAIKKKRWRPRLTAKPIPLPKSESKYVFTRTKAGTIYIYAEGLKVYDEESGIYFEKRTLIGKSSPDIPKLIIPNDRFFELFPKLAAAATTAEDDSDHHDEDDLQDTSVAPDVAVERAHDPAEAVAEAVSCDASASDAAAADAVVAADAGTAQDVAADVGRVGTLPDVWERTGRVVDGRRLRRIKRADIPDPSVDGISVGTCLLMQKMAQDIGVWDLLPNHFEQKINMMLDYATFIVVDENNVAARFTKFADSHVHSECEQYAYSRTCICNFFSILENEHINVFLEDWIDLCDKSKTVCLAFESTALNCSSGELEIHESVGTDDVLPYMDLNAVVAYGADNSRPLTYKVYDGPVYDMPRLKNFQDLLARHNMNNTCVFIDKGSIAYEQLEFMDAKGMDFMLCVKGHQSLIAELISEHKESLAAAAAGAGADADAELALCSCVLDDVCAVTVKRELAGKSRSFNLYYSESRAKSERSSLMAKLDAMESEIEKAGRTKNTFSKEHQKYFRLHYDEQKARLQSFERNQDAIDFELSHAGYFALITSKDMSAAEAYKLYARRDVNEHLLMTIKSKLGKDASTVYEDSSLVGKLFVEFLASVLRCRMYSLLTDCSHDRRYGLRDAIKLLERIIIKRGDGHSFFLAHDLDDEQVVLLEVLGMRKDAMLEKIDEVCALMAEI